MYEPENHSSPVYTNSLMQFSILFAVAGFFAGRIAAVWAASMIHEDIPTGLRECRACRQRFGFVRQMLSLTFRIRCSKCRAIDCSWPIAASVISAAAFSIFAWLLVDQGCQSVAEVQPSMELWKDRLPFHLLFVFFLTTATIADLLDYVIPDVIVIIGIFIAITFATLSGELQIIHVWVDWDDEMVSLYGPYLPEWMKQHQHLHGLAWSLCGLAAGAGIMWSGRLAAHVILRMPAIGFGDVTLMAMIGAFMGWQPTLCVLAIAPLVGVVLGLGGHIVTGRSFVAFGPYLCFAAYIVLCTWRLLWEELQLKIIFSHWPTVTGMVAGAFAAYCLLLVGLQVFKAVPAEKLR